MAIPMAAMGTFREQKCSPSRRGMANPEKKSRTSSCAENMSESRLSCTRPQFSIDPSTVAGGLLNSCLAGLASSTNLSRELFLVAKSAPISMQGLPVKPMSPAARKANKNNEYCKSPLSKLGSMYACGAAQSSSTPQSPRR